MIAVTWHPLSGVPSQPCWWALVGWRSACHGRKVWVSVFVSWNLEIKEKKSTRSNPPMAPRYCTHLYSNPSKRFKACGTLRGLVALWNLRVKVRKATTLDILDWVLCSGPIRSWEPGKKWKNARKQNCSKALKTWIAWRILQTRFGILDVAAFAFTSLPGYADERKGPKNALWAWEKAVSLAMRCWDAHGFLCTTAPISQNPGPHVWS